jgi:two-component system, NtrC family, nitrogen regulation sensor histidine kinase NtrY
LSLKRALVLVSVAIPPAIVAFALSHEQPGRVVLPIAGALVVSSLIGWVAVSTEEKKLRTLSAVLAAYREGDFSIRPKRVGPSGAFMDVQEELNGLGEVLRSHRLSEMEAWSLLRKVMSEVDVVVLAIDDKKRIRLANDAAATLLQAEERDLLGADSESLGLGSLLEGEAPRILDRVAVYSESAFELRRGSFRLAGEPHTLLVLSDVSRALRDNERDAWKKLIRVMGHEINNSLTPIRSISESLLQGLPRTEEEDLKSGLEVITRRADALNRFMTSYAMLAKLPPPQRSPTELAPLVRKVIAIDADKGTTKIEIKGGPDVVFDADAVQLEQALINLVKNAREAMKMKPGKKEEDDGSITIAWKVDDDGSMIDLRIEDEGPGVADATGLFVPFFTTKPEGSGIGLVLSRQIVEAHDGKLSLSSRTDGKSGAIARMRLPTKSSASSAK